MSKNAVHTISMCLGSSCFANGNHTLLGQVQAFLEENNLKDLVELKGSLCQGKCKDGPSIIIDNSNYTHLSEKLLESILTKHLLSPEESVR